eukprot:15437504-Alexandrium_andersonii.AAC.1
MCLKLSACLCFPAVRPRLSPWPFSEPPLAIIASRFEVARAHACPGSNACRPSASRSHLRASRFEQRVLLEGTAIRR